MIRNDKEKRRVVQQIEETNKLLEANRQLLRDLNFAPEAIESAVSATANVLKQLQSELDEYEQLITHKKAPEEPITNIGELLVKLRIYQNMTQRQLADSIGVDETQVSRDERNRYKGVSLERLLNVVKALNIDLWVTPHDLVGSRIPEAVAAAQTIEEKQAATAK